MSSAPCYTITKTTDSNEIKYAPAEVTDNLLSVTCYVTKGISVSGGEHYQVSTLSVLHIIT